MMTKHWVFASFFFLLIIIIPNTGNSQTIPYSDSIIWDSPIKTNVHKDFSFFSLRFSGGIYPKANSTLPIYSKRIKLEDLISNPKITVHNIESRPLSDEEISIINSSENNYLTDSLLFTPLIYEERKVAYLNIQLCPIFKNKSTNRYEKVIRFNISINSTSRKAETKGRSYASNSVLASGKWNKIGVIHEGIHIIRQQDIVAMGLNPNTTEPANASIFGNGGTPIPEYNSTPRPDDLKECAITVVGGGDGKFDATDYILFFTKSSNEWLYNSTTDLFEYNRNIFSDYAYYFITFDSNIGEKKRIITAPTITDPITLTLTDYDYHTAHEKELTNLAKSGSDWLGEEFDYKTDYSFPFQIPNIKTSEPIKVGLDVASSASSSATFTVSVGSSTQSIAVGAIASGNIKATEQFKLLTFTPTSSTFNVNLSYNKPTSLAIGWLNRIVIHAKCNLTQSESQMMFRNPQSIGVNNIVKYQISNTSTASVWDVTDINNIKSIPTTPDGPTLSFVALGDTLREFASYTGQSYFSPILIGAIENQNLHALTAADMVIITHPSLKSEAERLQTFHQNERGLTVHVVTIDKIYNEFGSGTPDISAIRDFAKMFYDKYGPSKFKYMLLFGDASYDYRNILNLGQNFVPTYENKNSTNDFESYSSDDFFGLLDETEGLECRGLLDIGIGRFVVKSSSEASQMVDKTINYCRQADLTKYNPSQISNFGDWKNSMTIIGDDEDGNTHLSTALILSKIIETKYPKFNLEKIFLDAYPQVSNSGGQRYPDVEVAINERMRKGTLLMNYVGHGGELGWAHERILGISDIESWSNKYNQPVMFTATCEFTRYDDPSRVSAGELVFLNNNGGAVALYTTSRVAWSSTNEQLGINFFNNAFTQIDGASPSLGDLIRISKNLDPSHWANLRNFVLIGDPSIGFADPKFSIKATHINGNAISSIPDTLKALARSTIKGMITDNSGSKLNNFNGEASVTIFDKPSNIRTLANDPDSPPVNFTYQKNVIFKGKCQANHGEFEISFIVPKDITYNYGNGKISFYAKCDTADASGFFSDIIIGGVSNNPVIDNTPPIISLYMNDENFTNLGLTNESPVFIAQVSDSSGINVLGSTIGHDAVITLDHQTENSISINDYFENEVNSYQKGAFKYPMKNLSEGTHTLTFKVWDILNNSSEKSIEFRVVKQAELKLDHVLNYPNPFSTHTDFFFEHNQAESTMDVRIQIFTITGKLINTINQNTTMNGFRSEGISWDGTDEFGDKLAKGVYLYKLTIKTDSGHTAEKIEKLVII